MTENFERMTKQMTELKNTTQQLSQRFETMSDRVTKQEETLVTFTHETKNNITRCETQLTQIVNVQQEVNTRVEELAQAHTSASSTQEKLTEEVGNITQQLTMVVLEQTHLKEKIEKLEDRADLASLNNTPTWPKELYTNDILSKAKTHVKDETKHIEDEVTKLRDNVVPYLVIGVNASSGNDKTAKTMANDTDRTPIVESPISNQNYNVPLSFPPNEQYYDTTPRVANQMDVVYRGDSCHSNFTHVTNQNQHPPQRNRSDGGWWNHPPAPRHNTMPARETYSNGNVQYNNNNNRRRENNQYNPGYFDRNYKINKIK
ncbi:SWI5-dependent HO expression protein 3-like [Schistocerca piceifrons]|uniref:SWI5-dependent HO expression protein 3-like n=1 Tax=Schistocerca piceifrons TaxID=274613 RepID=UPI001F5EAC7D|nr:SWI5-dependent HO expression protein 3-like [Schistocerca piceifrons]